MKNISSRVAGAAVMLRMEMNSLGEYCTNADAFFTRRLSNFKKEVEIDSDAFDEDCAVDTKGEMETHLDYNCYFGIMTAFGAFERFLTNLYGITLHLGTAPELRDVMLKQMQPWMPLDRYKDFFNALDFNIAKPDKTWQELKKLQAIRNAVVHQNGFVTDENIRFLSRYSFTKVGRHIKVTLDDVLTNIELVKKATAALQPRYIEALKKKKLIPKS